MKNFPIAFTFFFLFFCSCDFYQKDYQSQIQGDWISEFSSEDQRRLLFSFEDSIGSYSYSWGNFTPYEIKSDTIFIKEKIRKRVSGGQSGGKKIFRYKIEKLTKSELYLLPADSVTKAHDRTDEEVLKLSKTTLKSNFKFTRIGFYSSVCYGACPNIYLELDSLGNVFFHGKRYTDSLGFYSGELSKSDLKLVVQKINSINFKNLKLRYESGGTDQQFRAIFLKTTNRNYETSVYGMTQKIAEIEFLFHKLMEVYKNVDLKKDSSIQEQFQFNDFINRAESYVY